MGHAPGLTLTDGARGVALDRVKSPRGSFGGVFSLQSGDGWGGQIVW